MMLEGNLEKKICIKVFRRFTCKKRYSVGPVTTFISQLFAKLHQIDSEELSFLKYYPDTYKFRKI